MEDKSLLVLGQEQSFDFLCILNVHHRRLHFLCHASVLVLSFLQQLWLHISLITGFLARHDQRLGAKRLQPWMLAASMEIPFPSDR